MTEKERAERATVIAEALAWRGTPYRHQARIKGECADCTFFAIVYETCGLVPHVEIPAYSPQAHLNRESGAYRAIVERFARETARPQPGDIVLYHIGRDWSHGGVIIEPGWPHIVHGDMEAGFVLEAFGNKGRLAKAPRRFYTLWP